MNPRAGPHYRKPLVVGAGPVGLAAALFLARDGIMCRIVETAAERTAESRALGVNPRTLELLEPTGVTEKMLAEGLRMSALNIHRRDRAVRLGLGDLPHRYPFMLILPQADSERLLAEACAAHGIAIERRVTARAAAIDGDEAVVTLVHADGEEETVRSGLVVAADGARSKMRTSLGNAFPGQTYPEPWRLVDLELEMPGARREAHVFLDARGVLALIPFADDGLWRAIAFGGDPRAKLPPNAKTGRVVWESEFRISNRSVERLSLGPVHFAGDAAHIHSPIGARGMNLGIEDAYVLSALAVRGRLGDYENLRRPVVRRVISQVDRATRIVMGRSLPTRMMRAVLPTLLSVAPGLFRIGRRQLLGIDHEALPGEGGA